VTRGTDLEGSGGGSGSPEQRVPLWHKPSSGERRWWSIGAAEGVGKGVKGAHGLGAELGVVSGSSEGVRGVSSRWFNDGSMMAQWWRRSIGGKMVVHRGGAPFIAGESGGTRAAWR
jgi:hypothetical protein